MSVGFAVLFLNNKENKNVHIFYCADDGNAMQTCVSLASVLDNASDDSKINVHIVSFKDNKMSNENISKIEALKKSIKDFKLEFTYFDKSRLDEFETDGWNKAIMVKLFAAELFPNLKRIIWIDDDTVYLKDIKELYNRDMHGKCLAAVDVAGQYNKNWGKECPYWITAGVGLYNLEEIRKTDMQKSLLDAAKKYTKGQHATKGFCGGSEEYALTNGIPKEKTFLLPYEYSVMASLFGKNAYKHLNVDSCVMLHFAGPKPWKMPENIDERFLGKWNYYFDKTEYKNV